MLSNLLTPQFFADGIKDFVEEVISKVSFQLNKSLRHQCRLPDKIKDAPTLRCPNITGLENSCLNYRTQEFAALSRSSSLTNSSDWLSCSAWCVCVFVLLIDPLSPHEDFGLAVQREGAVVFPEAVKQLHVFEVSVLVAHWEHTSEQRFENSPVFCNNSTHATGKPWQRCSRHRRHIQRKPIST